MCNFLVGGKLLLWQHYVRHRNYFSGMGGGGGENFLANLRMSRFRPSCLIAVEYLMQTNIFKYFLSSGINIWYISSFSLLNL
jgi:hypothetical protein